MENKRKLKYLLILIGLVLLGASICYLPFVIQKIPFEFVTIDTREQNFVFYNEFQKIINSFLNDGKLIFYSWSDFLGTNFLISKVFYLTTDIFTIISILLNMNFWDSLMIFQIIKCILSALGIYWLLSKYKLRPQIKILGGIAYAFCASMCYFTVYNSFSTFFVFTPIYLVSIEYFLKNKHKWFLSLMTLTLAVTNYYFFFTISFFTVVYVLFRYLSIYGFENNKKYYLERTKQTFEMIAYYFIGVLMSMFILYPVLLYLSNNQRIGGYEFNLLYDNIKIYFQILASTVLPLHTFKGISYPFNPGNYSLSELFFWAGSFIVLVCPLVLIRKKDNIKLASLFGLGVIACIMFFPFGIQAMHGFSDVSFRGTVFFQILIIIITCLQIENINLISKKYIMRIIICVTILIISIFGISIWMLKSADIAVFKDSIMISIFILLSIYLLGFLMLRFKNNKNIIWIIIFFTFIEIVGVWYYALIPYSIPSDRNSYEFMNKATTLLQDRDNGLNDYLNGLEPANNSEYYRVYVDKQDLYWDFGQNAAMFYDLNSLSTYNSLFAPSLQKLYEIAPEMLFSASTYISINEPNIMNFVNTKYALVANEKQLPTGIDWKLLTDNYRGWISVYKNENYRPLGTMYTNIKSYDEYTKSTDFEQYILCETDDIASITNLMNDDKGILENIRYEDNHLFGTISSNGGFMIMTIPYDEGWNIRIDGNNVEKFNVNGGFIGIGIPDGDVSLEMYYSIPGLKVGSILSFIGILSLIVLQVCYNYKKFVVKRRVRK